MNGVHLHLLLNHVPVIGTVIGILLLAFARMRRSDELLRASLGLFVLLAASAIAVYLTGDGAEDLVKRLPDVSKPLIERHEEAALIATIALGCYGIAAVVALFVARFQALPRWTATAALVLALVPGGLMAWTANLGGQIRHTEIRRDAPVVTAPAALSPTRMLKGSLTRRAWNADAIFSIATTQVPPSPD